MSSFFYFSILDANYRNFVTTNDKVDHLDKRCYRDHDDRKIHNNLDLHIFFVQNDLKVEQQHQSQLFPGCQKKFYCKISLVFEWVVVDIWKLQKNSYHQNLQKSLEILSKTFVIQGSNFGPKLWGKLNVKFEGGLKLKFKTWILISIKYYQKQFLHCIWIFHCFYWKIRSKYGPYYILFRVH